MTNERGLISIEHAGLVFDLHVPSSASPLAVAGVLLAVTPRLKRGNFDAGEVAADFVACIDPVIRVRLSCPSRRADALRQVDYHYTLRHSPLDGPRIVVVRYQDGKEGERLFDGKLVDFTTWAEKQTGLEHLVQKVVQFVYDGGSSPDQVRTVRVEKVLRAAEGDHILVEGYDLARPDLAESYRRYSSDRIRGGIKVLN